LTVSDSRTVQRRSTTTHWKRHILAPPAALSREITVRVDILVTQPAVAVLVLEELQGARWLVSLRARVCSLVLFHDVLSFRAVFAFCPHPRCVRLKVTIASTVPATEYRAPQGANGGGIGDSADGEGLSNGGVAPAVAILQPYGVAVVPLQGPAPRDVLMADGSRPATSFAKTDRPF
jgi:hypothetical protein